MEQIEFTNVAVLPNGFQCTVKSSKREKADDLYFTLNTSLYFSADAIACALSTLCGQSYQKIYFSLELTQRALDDIHRFTKAEVLCDKIVAGKRFYGIKPPASKKVLVNFSGGFDSLALIELLPKTSQALVCVDFQGGFKREADFFQKFDPYILTTNFRTLKYDVESWTFMGVASILLAEQMSASYMTFGSILEASEWHFIERRKYNMNDMPFSFVGLRSAKLTYALTEVGTTAIAAFFHPSLVNESLQSLAPHGSTKKYRKYLLAKIYEKKANIDLGLAPCPKPQQKETFGRYFATDFLTPYFIKNLDRDTVGGLVDLESVPKEVFELSERLSLDFYDRFNTNFTNAVPAEYYPFFVSRLLACGIVPYDENDWYEFGAVRQMLGGYGVGRQLLRKEGK